MCKIYSMLEGNKCHGKKKDRSEGEDEGQDVVLNKVVRVGLIERSEQRFEGVKR